jgi:ribonuclease III
MPTSKDRFLRKLQYQFSDPALLQEALRHSSFVNEQPNNGLRDNERFEFLGDAVLNLVIGYILMQRYPELKEGELSRMRAALVNESQLSRIARLLRLGGMIQLGKGEEQTHGRKKSSILADAFEAVIAAVFLDGGYKAAYQFIEHHFADPLRNSATHETDTDFKSRLQELVQLSNKFTPRYVVIAESGPDHAKIFTVQVDLKIFTSQGVGKSKKLAEQDAARCALAILEK